MLAMISPQNSSLVTVMRSMPQPPMPVPQYIIGTLLPVAGRAIDRWAVTLHRPAGWRHEIRAKVRDVVGRRSVPGGGGRRPGSRKSREAQNGKVTNGPGG